MSKFCEKCGLRPASYIYTRRIGGSEKKIYLCAACAQSAGIGSALIGNMLFGNIGALPYDFSTPVAPIHPKKCDLCSSTLQEILRSGKVGCPRCYQIFSKELEDSIRHIHGGAVYRGELRPNFHASKEPANDPQTNDASLSSTAPAAKEEPLLEQLQKQLKKAVEAEDYESAAGLRDRIRELQKNREEEEHHGMV